MCAAVDQIVTVELAWLLAGSVVWMLSRRPGSRASVGGFLIGVGTIVAWPIIPLAIVVVAMKRRAAR